MQSSLCNSLQDAAPIDEIYVRQMFQWVAVTWHKGNQDSSCSNVHEGNILYLDLFAYSPGLCKVVVHIFLPVHSFQVLLFH